LRQYAETILKAFDPAVAPLAQFISFVTLAVSAFVIVLGMVAEPFTDRDRILYIVAKEQLKEFSKAMEEYRQDCGAYPAAGHGLMALISNPRLGCWKGPYLRSVPHDPWDRPYEYRLDPI
jgi:type II secretion system protein G